VFICLLALQIIPFLALGLGVDDMFFILHIYRNLNVESWTAAVSGFVSLHND